MTLEDTLRPLIREIVREVVAELRTTAPAAEYSSECPAEGVEKRAHNRRCASGRVKGARKEGRIWRCSREAWHASFVRKPEPTEDAYAAAIR